MKEHLASGKSLYEVPSIYFGIGSYFFTRASHRIRNLFLGSVEG